MCLKQKNRLFFRVTTLVLCGAFLCLTWPAAPLAGGTVGAGAPTSSEAAGVDFPRKTERVFNFVNWRPAPSFFAAGASAFADTTELEFPEDEEVNEKNLVRDVGIFIVVSAFVGFFLIKVFLEGDTQEPPPDDNGKPIP